MAKPFFIGISGASCSGKTTLAEHLARSADSTRIILTISLDNFYHDLPEGVSGETYNWDNPSAFDWEKLLKVMNDLSQNKPITLSKHNFATYSTQSNTQTMYDRPIGIVIFEGIHMFYEKEVRKMFDLRLFIEAPARELMTRRIIRDEKDRNYTAQVILTRYLDHVLPAQKRWIDTTARYAHQILRNLESKPLIGEPIIRMLKITCELMIEMPDNKFVAVCKKMSFNSKRWE